MDEQLNTQVIRTDKALNVALLKQDLYNVLVTLRGNANVNTIAKNLNTVQGSQETNDELMIATSVLVALQRY